MDVESYLKFRRTATEAGTRPYCTPSLRHRMRRINFSLRSSSTAGNLYGTTEFGGAYNWSAVFKLSLLGTGWAVTILYSFTGWTDGGHPATGLIMDRAGNLYGTTSEYLAPGNVFELSQSGGGWTLQVIYAAPTAPD
jgi:hypothetical protein